MMQNTRECVHISYVSLKWCHTIFCPIYVKKSPPFGGSPHTFLSLAQSGKFMIESGQCLQRLFTKNNNQLLDIRQYFHISLCWKNIFYIVSIQLKAFISFKLLCMKITTIFVLEQLTMQRAYNSTSATSGELFFFRIVTLNC